MKIESLTLIAVGSLVETTHAGCADLCSCNPADFGQGKMGRTPEEIYEIAERIAACVNAFKGKKTQEILSGDFYVARKNIKKITRQLPEVKTLPADGMSRFSQFKPFCPISKERFRQLVKEGRAPQPVRLGIRCTMYPNRELHRWLADPVNYQPEASA